MYERNVRETRRIQCLKKFKAIVFEPGAKEEASNNKPEEMTEKEKLHSGTNLL